MGLIFFDRADLRLALNVSDDLQDKSIIYRAYLKAYTTGIIDNIDNILDMVCENPDMSYYEFRNKLFYDISELKTKAWQEFEDII